MADRLIFWSPWVIAFFGAFWAVRVIRTLTPSYRFVCSYCLSAGLLLALLHFQIRPRLLRRQVGPVEQMELRNNLAAGHIQSGRLQAAESLLFQVKAEAVQIEHSGWTLNEVRSQCLKVHAKTDGISAHLRRVGDGIANNLGQLLQRHEFEKAISLVESADLDDQDGFGYSIQSFLWHIVSDDITAADASLKRLHATEINLIELRRVVQMEREAIGTRHKTVAQSVKELVEHAAITTKIQPLRKGRAMVWDFTQDNIEEAYTLLPDRLRATSRDGVLTIFCIRKRDHIEVGRYSISNQPALKEIMEIAVVYWPDGECAGVTFVHGGQPAQIRKVRSSPGYGSSVEIKKWIEGLPEDPSVTALKPLSRSPDDLRAFLHNEEARKRAKQESLAKQEREELQRKEDRARQQSEQLERDEADRRRIQEEATYAMWLPTFNDSISQGDYAGAMRLAKAARTNAKTESVISKLTQDAAVAAAMIALTKTLRTRMVALPYRRGAITGTVIRVEGQNCVVKLPFGEASVPFHEFISSNLVSAAISPVESHPETLAAAGLILWHSNHRNGADDFLNRAKSGGMDATRYVGTAPESLLKNSFQSKPAQ